MIKRRPALLKSDEFREKLFHQVYRFYQAIVASGRNFAQLLGSFEK